MRIGLTATLDIAQPGDRILCVSFGSEPDQTPSTLLVTDKVTGAPGPRHENTRVHRPPHRIDYATQASSLSRKLAMK
ncbi:hypothetical protein [Candidatus Villigracilis proximus]|uniref:hypothetical protein n=1 Tax=Candidatus Villigracilis proximus TaxID=3140683 RepID=UPI0031EDA253